jgi:hypothetical protein
MKSASMFRLAARRECVDPLRSELDGRFFLRLVRRCHLKFLFGYALATASGRLTLSGKVRRCGGTK